MRLYTDNVQYEINLDTCEVYALEFGERTPITDENIRQRIVRKAQTRQRSNNTRKAKRHAMDDAMRSLGLTKVRGPVSGKVYWE